jgi:hypothetical protein
MDDKLEQELFEDDRERQEEELRVFYKDRDLVEGEDIEDGEFDEVEGGGEVLPNEQAPAAQSAKKKSLEARVKEAAGDPVEEKSPDAMEKVRQASLNAALEKLEKPSQVKNAGPISPPPLATMPGDALGLLHNSQPPGIFFKEWDQAGGQGGEAVDPELLEAVEEVRNLLEGTKGIGRVSPGQDEQQQPVVLVVAAKGFGRASLKKVPERARRFYTLIAIPYELLPLKRDLEEALAARSGPQ